MQNRGSTLILTNLVGVHPKNTHTKFEANQCSGSREVKNGIVHSGIYNTLPLINFQIKYGFFPTKV